MNPKTQEKWFYCLGVAGSTSRKLMVTNPKRQQTVSPLTGAEVIVVLGGTKYKYARSKYSSYVDPTLTHRS